MPSVPKLAQAAKVAKAAQAAAPSPFAHAVAVAFEGFGSPALTEIVQQHLLKFPHEAEALARFTMAHGLPRLRPERPYFQKTHEVAADAVMVLRQQQPTPFKHVFPSKELGDQLAEWTFQQLQNTGHLRTTDPRYPWGVFAMRDWLFNGPLNVRSDALSARFWKAADEMTREPYFGLGPSVRGGGGGGRKAPAAAWSPSAAPAPAAAAPAPVAAPARTGYVNPWEAVAHPSFSGYLRAVAGGYGRGWLEFRDGR